MQIPEVAGRLLIVGVVIAALTPACAKKQPPLARPAPPAASGPVAAPPAPPPPPQPVAEPLPMPSEPLAEDAIANRSLDDLNRDSPLRPVFFPIDSSELDDAGRATVGANADVLRKYPSWVVTIEGHCDERGTAEYNLALGERRAIAVKTYLLSLGLASDRFRTVSYGKEFPFDPAHDESAWAKNRRAHFVITAK